MRNSMIEHVENQHLKPDLPRIDVGDTVDVHCRIVEGEKQRIQVFTGVVISTKGTGMNQAITVRRIVANEGVERIFPLHSPNVANVEIVRHGHTRRSKLYFLRDRVGKKRRLKDRRRGLHHEAAQATQPKTPPAKPQNDANETKESSEA